MSPNAAAERLEFGHLLDICWIEQSPLLCELCEEGTYTWPIETSNSRRPRGCIRDHSDFISPSYFSRQIMRVKLPDTRREHMCLTADCMRDTSQCGQGPRRSRSDRQSSSSPQR